MSTDRVILTSPSDTSKHSDIATSGTVTQATLVTSGAISVAVGAIYILVGRAASHKDLAPAPRRAMHLYQTWWYCIGGVTLVLGVNTVLASAGIVLLAYHVAFYYALLAAMITGLFGLSYYLAYLRLGEPRWLIPLGAFHAAFALLFFYSVAAARPVAVHVGEWQTHLTYSGGAKLGGALAPLLVLVIVPSLLGATGYFLTFFKTRNVVARYRIAAVSLALAGWFGSTLLASVTGLIEETWWPIATRLIGLLAAIAILAAYRPPTFVRAKLEARQQGDGA